MDLSFLRELYNSPGPFTSIYLDASHDSPDAVESLRMRWKDIARDLADSPTRDAVLAEAENGSAHVSGRHGLAIFAAGQTVQYAEVTPAVPDAPIVEVGRVPRIAPLLTLRGEHVPWLHVTVHRAKADVLTSDDDTIHLRASRTYPIRKTRGPAWQQEHGQRAAELNWLRNAKEMARDVDRLATEAQAELLFIDGDVREAQLLSEQLPVRWKDRIVMDGSVEDEVAKFVNGRRAGILDALHAGGDEAGVSGLPGVVDALNQGRVDTLLLGDDPHLSQALLIATDIEQLGFGEAQLVAEGAREIVQSRADDALIRAAALTGAEAMPIAGDEVKALLRWPES